MSVLIVFFVVFAIYFVTFRLKRKRLYELARLIPGDDGHPLLGEIPRFFGIDTKEYINTLFNQIKSDRAMTKAWFGPNLTLLTKDPDVAHAIFNTPHALKKPTVFYYGLNVPHGLLAANGDEYEKHRKIISRAFSPYMLQHAIPIFSEKSRKCVEVLGTKVGTGDFDVSTIVGTCALEAFFTKNYDYDVNFYDSSLINGFLGAKELITKRIYKPWYNLKLFYKTTAIGRKFDTFNAIARGHLSKILANGKNNSVTEAKGDILVNLMNNPKFNFSNDEITDEFTTFIYVTFDTSAFTMSTILLMLAMHKDVQRKVIQEIDEVCATVDDIDRESLNKFSYLELVMKEAMRIYPTCSVVARETTGEIELGGHTVPEGTTVVVSLYLLHRNEKFWGSDAHLFKPERFAPENFEKIHPNAFLPFTSGKRICTGAKYSLLFMKVFLIHFFKRFTIDTQLRFEELTIEALPTLSIAQKYMISLTERGGQ